MVIIQQDILTERLAYLGGQTAMGGQSERKEGTETLIRSPVYWFVSVLLCLLENVWLQACRLSLAVFSVLHPLSPSPSKIKAPLGRWRAKTGEGISGVCTWKEAPLLVCNDPWNSFISNKQIGVFRANLWFCLCSFIQWLVFKLLKFTQKTCRCNNNCRGLKIN